jgi:hypothetical protein
MGRLFFVRVVQCGDDWPAGGNYSGAETILAMLTQQVSGFQSTEPKPNHGGVTEPVLMAILGIAGFRLF